jgi:16S rRNA (adenine1518-N6/adenine1519-N6)-dimethyltransferase
MMTRSQLKDTFARYGFRPLKRFGENYLTDANIKDKIIAEASLSRDDTVLEIGPGLGALTIDLASSGASIIAVEKDRKAFAMLKDIIGDRFPRLDVVNEDILRFDMGAICAGRKIKLIGNLPYYITAPIMAFIIDNRDAIDFALVTVQREVANRILASPGGKDYGALSCFAQYYARGRYLHTVKRTSFYPEPEVDSSIIRLDMLAEPSVAAKSEEMLFKVIRGSFNQRRKSIINSLSREEVLGIPKGRLAGMLRAIDIDPSSRPETLSLSDFARIADSV